MRKDNESKVSKARSRRRQVRTRCDVQAEEANAAVMVVHRDQKKEKRKRW